MVRSVRERFEVARPVRSASSLSDLGWVSMISFSKSRFWSDKTWDKDCRDSNHTFGSPFAGTYSPRAIAIVRFLYASLEAIPTFRVFMALCSFLSKSTSVQPTMPLIVKRTVAFGRRGFVKFLHTSLIGALFIAPAVHAQDLDLVLRNGTVIDGSGAPSAHTDIGIAGDRIVLVGSSAGRKAKRVIDATGLIITPGFIDPHTHTADDLTDPKRGRNEAYLMQGVSTVATGNDGDSPEHTGDTLARWTRQGIGTNATLFIGEGTV